MTRAQSAARLSLEVMPGARLLKRLRTRCPRLGGASARWGWTRIWLVVGTDRGITEDDGGGAAGSASRGAGDASRSELASSGEGTSTGSRELDDGVFWQEELAFIAGVGGLKSRDYRESISRRFLGRVGGASLEAKIERDFGGIGSDPKPL